MSPTERRRGQRADVQSVTSAPLSRKQDRDNRMRRYLIAMGVRTASFPLAVWAFMAGWTALGWVLAAAAVVLPSIAVFTANIVDERRIAQGATAVDNQRRLERGSATEPGDSAQGEPLVLGPEDIVRGPAPTGQTPTPR